MTPQIRSENQNKKVQQPQPETNPIDTLRNAFGRDCIKEQNWSTHPAIATGLPAVDKATGIGGLPRGKICEIFGPESGGKTGFCLHLIRKVQDENGIAAIIDAEHALNIMWMQQLGIQINNVLINQPNSGEEALTVAEKLIASKQLDIIIIDSVAALTPEAELSGDIGQTEIGAQAHLMDQALRKIALALSGTKTCCIFTNQIRERIETTNGPEETTPGGRALKEWASMRIRISPGNTIQAINGTVIGIKSQFDFVKNKMGEPHAKTEARLLFQSGYEPADGINTTKKAWR